MSKCDIASVPSASVRILMHFHEIPVVGGLYIKKLFPVLKKSWKSLEFQSPESVGALNDIL